ncbi:hypothetical protein ACJW31_05G031200 [Castanea mollissima]
MKFLMGLNESFSQVRTQVLLMDPIPSLSKVYSLLIQVETQNSVSNTSVAKVDSTVLAAKMPNDHHGTNLATGEKYKEIEKESIKFKLCLEELLHKIRYPYYIQLKPFLNKF